MCEPELEGWPQLAVNGPAEVCRILPQDLCNDIIRDDCLTKLSSDIFSTGNRVDCGS